MYDEKYDKLIDKEIEARAALTAAQVKSVAMLDAGRRDEALALIGKARAALTAIRREMIALRGKS